MDHYASDEERFEAFKAWVRANGGAVITGILIGVAVVVGWQFWTSRQAAQHEQASAVYDAMMQALARDDAAAAREQADSLIADYTKTPYASLAALSLAKLAADKGEYAAAAGHLQRVIDQSGQEAMKSIARLRLARVLFADNRLDEAEAELAKVTDPSFTAEREELKGDIYVVRNQPTKARAAYEAARAAQGLVGGSGWLQMKLDDLPPPAPEEKPS